MGQGWMGWGRVGNEGGRRLVVEGGASLQAELRLG